MLVNINWALIGGYSLQVEDMLKYIYGGKIENLEDKATKLLAAADQYDLKLLKKKCEELLCKSLNISNCLDYLILADMHSTDILKPLVIRLVRPLVLLNDTSNNVTLKLRFVVENSREVVTQENWKEKLMTFTDVFAEVQIEEKHMIKLLSHLYSSIEIPIIKLNFLVKNLMNFKPILTFRFSMSWRPSRLARSLEGSLRTGDSVEQAQEVRIL